MASVQLERKKAFQLETVISLKEKR